MANANRRKTFDRYYTESEEKSLFKLINEQKSLLAQRDYQWIKLLRCTGMRIGVLAGKDIKSELGKKTDHIVGFTVGEAKHTLAHGYFEIRGEIKKGGHDQSLLATKNAKACLTALIDIRKKMGYPEQSDQPLIMGQKGAGLSVRQFQERFKGWAQKAGLQGSPHWMRHTAAKAIMKQSTANDPRAIVQTVLDHQDMNTTLIYTMPDKEEVEAAMEEVM